MITKWTSHLPEDQKQQFQNTIYSSRTVLERLQQMLDEEKASLEQAEISPRIYETPNWDYKQAHTNGFKSALQMVSRIITLKDNNSEQSIRPE